MSYDEYLLALDGLETAKKNVQNDIKALTILNKLIETNLGKLALQEEHFSAALDFSKNKAKIVEIQVYVNTKRSLDECRKQAYNSKIEHSANKRKQEEAERMLKSIDEKIKSMKQTEKSFGKVLHYDIRRNTRTSS